MKNLTCEEFIRYRNQTGLGKIKIIDTQTETVLKGDTLQTVERIETFIATNGSKYKMHSTVTEGQKGVCYGPYYKYKFERVI